MSADHTPVKHKEEYSQEAGTQEYESQEINTPSQNELTQQFEPTEDPLSPLHYSPPPASLPWGRLVGIKGQIDLLPRHPSISTSNIPTLPSDLTRSFLGLEGLRTCDRFNEYVIGRSHKCDIITPKQGRHKHGHGHGPPPPTTNSTTKNMSQEDWVHSMISNRHCRIFSLLSSSSMEIYIEDSSGNGTSVNNTTLLSRGERRQLHTGDEICLINPATLRRNKLPSDVERKILNHYSYIFVNVHQQQAQSAVSKKRNRGAVDARATDSKSPQRRDIYDTSRSSSAVARGRRIEEYYDIRDLLGSGTCGEVRRAIHRQTGEQRAVKIISTKGRYANNATPDSIQAEAAILQLLNHPYIVKLFDVFFSPTSVYLVCELLHGGDLFDRIVLREKYNERSSRQIFRRILSAVYYLHQRDIVHRDLKPENILCVARDNDINIKLTDFGLAKSITKDGLKTFCGTPQYFAPEVLMRKDTVMGQGRYGKEADMWSLGIILYILLSGAPPFDVTDSIAVVAQAKIQFLGKRWAHISKEAKGLVMMLLNCNPKERIGVKEACCHTWILKNDGDTHCHPLQDPALRDVSVLNHNNKEPITTDYDFQLHVNEAAADNKLFTTTSPINRLPKNINDFTMAPPPQASPSPGKRRLKFHMEFEDENDKLSISDANADVDAMAQADKSVSSDKRSPAREIVLVSNTQLNNTKVSSQTAKTTLHKSQTKTRKRKPSAAPNLPNQECKEVVSTELTDDEILDFSDDGNSRECFPLPPTVPCAAKPLESLNHPPSASSLRFSGIQNVDTNNSSNENKIESPIKKRRKDEEPAKEIVKDAKSETKKGDENILKDQAGKMTHSNFSSLKEDVDNDLNDQDKKPINIKATAKRKEKEGARSVDLKKSCEKEFAMNEDTCVNNEIKEHDIKENATAVASKRQNQKGLNTVKEANDTKEEVAIEGGMGMKGKQTTLSSWFKKK